MLDLATVGLAFILIFPAELPDKTFIATLVLSTRYRRLAVWIGVAVAFAVQSAIAVAAGGLLSLLPQRLVLGVTFLLFAAGAVLMLVSGLRARSAELAEEEEEAAGSNSNGRLHREGDGDADPHGEASIPRRQHERRDERLVGELRREDEDEGESDRGEVENHDSAIFPARDGHITGVAGVRGPVHGAGVK